MNNVQVLTEIFMKIHEILKIGTNLNLNTFTFKEVAVYYSKSMFKLSIGDKLKKKELWMITKAISDVGRLIFILLKRLNYSMVCFTFINQSSLMEIFLEM